VLVWAAAHTEVTVTLWTETPFSSKDLRLYPTDRTVKIPEDGGSMFQGVVVTCLPVINTSMC